MKGQWLGSYKGSVDGHVMINIDEVNEHFEGVAYLNPKSIDIPPTAAHFRTNSKDDHQETDATLFPIDRRTGFQCQWEDIKKDYGDNVAHSNTAKVHLKFSNGKLKINATSDIGAEFHSTLKRPIVGKKSKISAKKMSWADFKRHVSTISKSRFLFRGQTHPWSLCTSYHRRGRYRMSEFTRVDVKYLHQRLSAITKHYFDLNIPDQNGAFINLLQHHGYPTPLLDWTHSPYVAAFFAFRGRPIGYSGNDYIRIYIFNAQEWRHEYNQIQNLDPPFPHLSVMEFIALENPRLVPQQSVTTVTNLYDIEAYILEKESESGIKFLEAIDIPANERETAMHDLQFMGITAGSMFPSIDGVCEEIRERNFDQ